MENNHLTYFKVENFKKFDSLEVSDIGQFNLIVGDNNVGKTCLLEALTLGNNPKEIMSSIFIILVKRKFIIYKDIDYLVNDIDTNFKNNVIGLIQKNLEKPIKIERKQNNFSKIIINEIFNRKDINPRKEIELGAFVEKTNLFNFKNINELSRNWLVFKNNLSSDKTEINFLCDITSSFYKDFALSSKYLPLVKLDDLYSDDLIIFFRHININPDNEDKLLIIINRLFPKIQIKRIIINEAFNKEEFIQVSTSDKIDYHSITNYGDGFIKIFRIILELFICKNSFICIDEVDSGIHHSKMKEFWVNIFRVAKELDIQVFATTHSQECIEAYVEAAKEMEEKNIRLIKVEEYKGKLYSSTFIVDNIEAGIYSNTNMRG